MFNSPLTRAIGIVALGLPATAVAQSSNPYRFVVDLRLHETGGKEVTVSELGDTVLMDLYVSVFGLDENLTNDGLQSVSGGFNSSTGGLGGDLLGLGSVAPFNSSGSAVGGQHDLDNDGDLDIGYDPRADDELEPWYRGRSAAPTLVTPTGGFRVGRVRFTVTSFAGDSTAINWVPRTDWDLLGPDGRPLYYGAGIHLDGRNTTINGDDPQYRLGAPVIVRATNVVDPGPAQYISGTINGHTTISSHVRPQPGTTLTLNGGVDVTASGYFDARDAHGKFGAHQAFVRDATSGNAGGAFMIGNVTVGSSETAAFTHAGGFTNIGTKLLVGDAAGSHGRVDIAGGNFNAATVHVGTAGNGTVRQTGGVANLRSLLVGTGAGQARFELVDGELSVADQTVISEGGTGAYEQSGGISSFGARLMVGGRSSATPGSLSLSGGTLNAPGFFDVGNNSSGQVTQTGGTVRGNRISVGAGQGFDVGGAAGRYTISGGGITTSSLLVGQAGSGVFVQHDGDVVSTFLTTVSAANASREARYELHGGSLRQHILLIATHPSGSDLPGHHGLFDQDGGVHVADRVTIQLGGTYRHRGGVFIVKDQLTNRGTLDFGNAAVTFNADRDAFVDLQAGTLTGEGNANFRGATGSLFSFPSGYDPFTQLGSIETEGLIHVAGQPLTIPAGHSVSGSGTIAGTVTNDGALNPGNSPGVLGVEGNYTQTGNGTLRIEIAGAEAEVFDQLTVTGSATLGGTLEIALLDDFVPAPEDTFMILSASARSGAFANADDQVAFNGGVFDVDYGSWYVQLSNFQAIPEPGSLAVFVIAPALMMWRRRRAG